MPYGCENVARPGPYGNPFTVAEHGGEAVPLAQGSARPPGPLPRHPVPQHQPRLAMARVETTAEEALRDDAPSGPWRR